MSTDPNMNNIIAKAIAELTVLAVKNTAGAVIDRVRTIKSKKDLNEQNIELIQIINDLIEDKNELIMVANTLKENLVSERITDEEIKYITETLLPMLKQFMSSDPVNYEIIAKVLSKDSLSVLQLLGFNFKQAIGDPLTILMRDFIISKSKVKNSKK